MTAHTASAAQRQASDPKCHVWVTANAGTGKTRVLTDRVLRLLLAGNNPECILCLTYTKNAAAEMRHRLMSTLQRWVTLPNDNLSGEISQLTGQNPTSEQMLRIRQLFLRLADQPDLLQMHTIHGFCQSLLRRFPVEAGIPPHFQVADEQTITTWIDEAWKRLLGQPELLDGKVNDAALRKAIHFMSTRYAESTLKEMIAEVLNHTSFISLLDAYTDINGLYDCNHNFYGTSQNTSLQTILINAYQETPHELLQEIHTILTSYDVSHSRTKPTFKALDSMLRATGDDNRLAAIRCYLSCFFTKDGSKPKEVAYLVEAQIRKTHAIVTEWISQEQPRMVALHEAVLAYEASERNHHFLTLCEAMYVLLEELKTQHAAFSHNDLIHFAVQLLNKQDMAPWVMFKLDGGITHLLIDEAQDTSPSQWQIVDTLTEEFFSGQGQHNTPRTLFVVGDEKQSIYSFQGADVEQFQAHAAHFADKAKTSGAPWERIPLETSYRSAQAILDVVDTVFSDPALHASVTEENGHIRHFAHREEAEGHVTLWPLLRPEEHSSSLEREAWPILDTVYPAKHAKRQMADFVARQVTAWLEEGFLLPKTRAPIQPADILILVRSRKELMPALVQSLSNLNIPVAGQDRLTLLEHLLTEDLLALGHAMLLPEDDLTLATLLKGPLFGLSEEALFTLAYNRGEASLWQRLSTAEQHLAIYQKLLHWQNIASSTSPFAFYTDVLDIADGRARLKACFGLEAEDVLNRFMEQVLTYEQLHLPTLQGFVRWIARGELEIKREMEQQVDGVRVMTVHGAKGLQAPVVILPDTTSTASSGKEPSILWPEVQSHLPAIPHLRGSAGQRPPPLSTLDTIRISRAKEEHARLLYVAMTRAEDRLYIGGFHSKEEAPTESWYHYIHSGMKQIGTHLEDGSYHYSSGPPPTPLSGCHSIKEPVKQNIPDHLYARTETITETQKALSSNQKDIKFTPTERTAMQRGIAIHRLLECLPLQLSRDKQEAQALQWLATNASTLPRDERQAVIEEALHILHHPKLQWIFTQPSFVEISGISNSKENAIQRIDRLVKMEDGALAIIDYKSGTPAKKETIQEVYQKQLQEYAKLIQKAVPNRPLRAFLLWTENATLMEIPLPLDTPSPQS